MLVQTASLVDYFYPFQHEEEAVKADVMQLAQENVEAAQLAEVGSEASF